MTFPRRASLAVFCGKRSLIDRDPLIFSFGHFLTDSLETGLDVRSGVLFHTFSIKGKGIVGLEINARSLLLLLMENLERGKLQLQKSTVYWLGAWI